MVHTIIDLKYYTNYIRNAKVQVEIKNYKGKKENKVEVKRRKSKINGLLGGK